MTVIRSRTSQIVLALMVGLMLALIAGRMAVRSAIDQGAQLHHRATAYLTRYYQPHPLSAALPAGWRVAGTASAYASDAGRYYVIELVEGPDDAVGRSGKVMFLNRLALSPEAQILRTDDPAAELIADALVRDLGLVLVPVVDPSIAIKAPQFVRKPSRPMRALLAVTQRYFLAAMGLCISVILITLVLVFLHARRKWSLGMACTACGYDLRGNRSGRCSECGEAVDFGLGADAADRYARR